MHNAATIQGLKVKEAFIELLDRPDCKLKNIKSLRYRVNNKKISLEKMIELLEGNGYKSIQDQVFIKA